MPPKSTVTREKIIEAGFEIVRFEGAEALSVRAVAARLGCSTQPIMYHFKTMEEFTAAVYERADMFHTEYIMSGSPMLGIGLKFVEFGAKEKHLFRFLFQSDKFGGNSFAQLVEAEELAPIISEVARQTGLSEEQSKRAFSVLFTSVHGLASLMANNSMEYDEDYCTLVLKSVFVGVVGAMKGGYI